MDGGGTRPLARLEGGMRIDNCATDVLGVGGIDAAREHFRVVIENEGVFTDVQMCKPVAGFATENLGGAVSKLIQRLRGS